MRDNTKLNKQRNNALVAVLHPTVNVGSSVILTHSLQ